MGGGEKYDLSHLIQLNLTEQEYEWPRWARERERALRRRYGVGGGGVKGGGMILHICILTVIGPLVHRPPWSPGFQIRIHLIHIRIQQFRLNIDPDTDPIRIQGFYDQKLKEKIKFFLDQKLSSQKRTPSTSKH